jgi:hypothetical protein
MRAGYFEDFDGLGVGVTAWVGRVRVGSGVLVPGVVVPGVGSAVVGSGAEVVAGELPPVEVPGIRAGVDCSGIGTMRVEAGLGTPTTRGPPEVVALAVGGDGKPVRVVVDPASGVVATPTDVEAAGPGRPTAHASPAEATRAAATRTTTGACRRGVRWRPMIERSHI